MRRPEFMCSLIAAAFLLTTAVSGASSQQHEPLAYEFRPILIGGGGFVTGLAIHPDPDGTAYARTDVGGMYRRDGERWTQLFTADALPPAALAFSGGKGAFGVARHHAYHVSAIAIDPADPDFLLAVAGRFKDLPGMVLRSRDRGATFEVFELGAMVQANGPKRFYNERLAIRPGGSIVFYGSRSDGLLRSTDGGETFARVTGVPAGAAVGVGPVVFDPDNPDVVFACVSGQGVFRSADAGATWEQISTLIADDLEIVNGVAYLAGTGAGIHRYEDGRWRDVTPPHRNVVDLAVHPAYEQLVYAVTAGGQRFFRSDDGGGSWQRLRASSMNPASRSMFRSDDIPWIESSTVREWLSVGDLRFDPRDPDRLWFAEGMGVWQSTPLSDADPQVGPAWDNASRGIEETVASDVHAAPGGKVTLLIRDRVGFFRPNAAALDRYPEAQIGLTNTFTMGVTVNASGQNPQFLVAAVTDERHPSGILGPRGYDGDGNVSGYSTDGGATWTVFDSIDPSTEFNEPRRAAFGEIAADAEDPNRLVWLPRLWVVKQKGGGPEQNVYFSRDRGSSWQAAQTGDLWDRRESFLTGKRSLAADPVIAGRFYAYNFKTGRLHRSDDGGETWSVAPGTRPSVVAAWHNQLRATPGRAEDLWMASGFDLRSPTAKTGLYHSTDGGMSWTKIDGVDEAWAIGHGAPEEPGMVPTLYLYGCVHGQWGVYRSTDAGQSFSLLSAAPLGLLDQVTCITGDPDVFGKVYLGFQGCGFAYGVPAEVR